MTHKNLTFWIALATFCVGIFIGLFAGRIVLRPVTNPSQGEHTPPPNFQHSTSPPESKSSGSILAAVHAPDPTDETVVADDPDPDDDLPTRHGILMTQSADETRQAIIANANLDDAQTARLDALIADMNRHMLDVSTKWADHIRATGTLDMDTRLRMQHDINGVSVSFSDKMDAEFPGWRAENTDLTRLVRITTAFEPFRKIRSEILRGEVGGRASREPQEDAE